MKLMTFNILHGGMGEEYGPRSDFIKTVIREASPDFVAVQEADDFEKDDSRRLREISEHTGLAYCALSLGTPREWDRQCNVASFSRYPFKKNFEFSGCAISGGALLSVIDSPLGKLAICNFQLGAHSEDVRLRELAVIRKRISRYEKQILLGDFNSVSLGDNYDIQTLQVESRFDVMDKLKRDYVDVAAHIGLGDRSTYPTQSSKNPTHTMPIRIDYILVSHSLAGCIKDAAVIKTPASEQASDHYPFVATLE
jgi:endonuclease/exonuclease/phosphatase family metal-dependent hydrolase